MSTLPYATPAVTLRPADGGFTFPDPTPVSRRALLIWALIVTAVYASLWSPNWYPLSDSSLFLGLGRSIAAGHGMTIQGDPVSLIPPGMPRLIALIIKAGGGIGTIQAVLIAMMLAAHAFCFATLRHWVGPRLALYSTVAGALSYWVYINAFTVMSEPPAMMFLWAGALLLTRARLDARGGWPRLLAGCACLLLAATFRDAILVLVPGLMITLLIWNGGLAWRRPTLRRPWGPVPGPAWRANVPWVAGFVATFGAWGIYRYPDRLAVALPAVLIIQGVLCSAAIIGSSRSTTVAGTLMLIGAFAAGYWVNHHPRPVAHFFGLPVAGARPTTAATTTSTTGAVVLLQAQPSINAEFDPDAPGALREGRYKAQWLYGVKRDPWHLLTEPPVLAGRWVSEGLVAASSSVFENKTARLVEALGKVVGGLGFIVICLGTLWLLMKRQWWMIPACLYFVSIWLQWGTRVKPRYMDPIAPLLFLVAISGSMVLVRLACKPFAKRGGPDEGKLLRALALSTLALVLIGNAFPYAIEAYIRRFPPRDFYSVARRGAYADLVDIAAYLQHAAKPDERVWLNDGAHRRIAYFLAGRPIQTYEAPCLIWADWDNSAGELKRNKALRVLRRNMPPADRYVIVHVEQPAKGLKWPSWHLPLAPADPPVTWWRLYERAYGKNEKGEPTETWAQVPIPPSRAYVRDIPPAPAAR